MWYWFLASWKYGQNCYGKPAISPNMWATVINKQKETVIKRGTRCKKTMTKKKNLTG